MRQLGINWLPPENSGPVIFSDIFVGLAPIPAQAQGLMQGMRGWHSAMLIGHAAVDVVCLTSHAKLQQ